MIALVAIVLVLHLYDCTISCRGARCIACLNIVFGQSDTDALSAQRCVWCRAYIVAKSVRLHNGRTLLPVNALVRPGGFLTARLALCGGKGGFGSTLRAMGKAGNTENTSDCRDLNGRRMRDVEAQQSAEEWAAGQKDRDDAKAAAKKEREEQKVAVREAEEKVRHFWKLCHSSQLCESISLGAVAGAAAFVRLCAAMGSNMLVDATVSMSLVHHAAHSGDTRRSGQDRTHGPRARWLFGGCGLAACQCAAREALWSCTNRCCATQACQVYSAWSLTKTMTTFRPPRAMVKGGRGRAQQLRKGTVHAHAPAADSHAADAGGSKADAALAVVGTDELQRSSEDDVTAAVAG